jgi:hypothetical protein
LAVQTGVTDGPTIHRDEVFNTGLPPLHNLTGHPVRLLWVRWVDQPAAARIVSMYAYTYSSVGYGVTGGEGNLPIACPDLFHPSAVTAAVTAPRADSRWFVVITFTISRVGVYHMNRVKIGYMTNGHKGWQYQNIDTTYAVVNPPMPGPVPIPRSGICG